VGYNLIIFPNQEIFYCVLIRSRLFLLEVILQARCSHKNQPRQKALEEKDMFCSILTLEYITEKAKEVEQL